MQLPITRSSDLFRACQLLHSSTTGVKGCYTTGGSGAPQWVGHKGSVWLPGLL